MKQLTLRLPEYGPNDEERFLGYRFWLPRTASYPDKILQNLKAIDRHDEFMHDPVWSTLLEYKLELLLGFPTDVPKMRNHVLSYRLLLFGECFLGPAIKLPLTQGQCHLNSSALWKLNARQLDLVKGFVMRRGEWFVHSWCSPKLERQVVETSQVMDFYFGFRYPENMARAMATADEKDASNLIIRDIPRRANRRTRLGTELTMALPPQLRAPSPEEMTDA